MGCLAPGSVRLAAFAHRTVNDRLRRILTGLDRFPDPFRVLGRQERLEWLWLKLLLGLDGVVCRVDEGDLLLVDRVRGARQPRALQEDVEGVRCMGSVGGCLGNGRDLDAVALDVLHVLVEEQLLAPVPLLCLVVERSWVEQVLGVLG